MVLLMLMSVTVALAGNAKDTQTGGENVKVIIGYVDKPNQADEDVIRGNGGKTKYTYNIINAKAVEIPEQAIDRIKNNPRVAYVEEDAEVYALDAELDSSWGVKRIGAGVVHGYNTGAGVNVAIIDTGIDYTHPDLNDNYRGGYDFVNSDYDPMDDAGHGTHCAGIVAAEDNNEGVVGVAPEANLYAAKVLDDTGSGYTSDVVAGIQWSMDNGMQIISMSLGSNSPSEAIEGACNNAYNSGIVVVASAGNSGNLPGRGDNVGYPAAYSSVIAVAATDSNDKRARWSSTGPDVELAAPGVSIYSTYMDGGYAYMSGTSMACPHVAGTAALVMAAYPEWNNSQVRQQMQDTAEDLGTAGFDYWYGYGLVDADEAASQPMDVHDIAVMSIVAPSCVVEGDLVSVGVSVTNEGKYDETFTLTLTDTTDAKVIGSEQVTLVAEASTTLTFSWNTTDATHGDHVLNATASVVSGETDTADNSMTGTVTVVEEAPANRMHIASIEMSFKTAGPNRNAIALVTIVDAADEPVEGATVYGTWSGATSDTDSGLTDASGEVSLKSNKVKNAPGETTFTFTVDDVSLTGWDYDSAANVKTSGSINVP